MKEKSDNWSSPADILQKITGTNSNLDSLVQLGLEPTILSPAANKH